MNRNLKGSQKKLHSPNTLKNKILPKKHKSTSRYMSPRVTTDTVPHIENYSYNIDENQSTYLNQIYKKKEHLMHYSPK